MKITFVGHASILIETKGVRIVSDPWWRGPCFGAQWWTYPLPDTEPLRAGVDYIYVSHGHHDHFHPGTLRTLPRTATCVVSANIGLGPSLRELGFPVVEIGDDVVHELVPGVACRIMETHGADTLFTIDDGDQVCVNLNDALHSAPTPVQDAFIARLKAIHPVIDYLFCGYGVASHFPNCYEIPGKDRDATATRRQAHFNRQWSRIVAGLAPRFAFPFAADVALLENDLIWSNEPTHNNERPVDVFRAEHPGSRTVVADIAPGFAIADHRFTHETLRAPTSLARLAIECADGIARANGYGSVAPDVFDEVFELVAKNVARCAPYLREHRGDYRFLVRFRNYPEAIEIAKRGRDVRVLRANATSDAGYDVVYVTRLHYLRASLTTPYGHEILFVGSGGIFRYARASDAQGNLHRELAVVLTPHEQSPRSRFGDQSELAYRLKRFAKRLVRRAPADLYDLATWTVWRGEQRP